MKIIGRIITDVRPMRDNEMEALGWKPTKGTRPVVLALDDDGALFCAADEDCKAWGVLFGVPPERGKDIVAIVGRAKAKKKDEQGG